MGESRNSYRVLVGRPEGKRPLGRPRRRWEDNIKIDLREVEYDDKDWINLAQDRDQWRAYVRTAMNLRSGRRKNDAETDQKEEKELVGSLAEKKLLTEECTRTNGDGRRYQIKNDMDHRRAIRWHHGVPNFNDDVTDAPPVPSAFRGGGSLHQPPSVNLIGSCIGREFADE
ncbi:hypothetical protein ANN_09861 [Periplaneta americana]|uniref:Uncharacterized protein n=1 Tax=Periplaneta americana TaxID=6978 RepID=A0ABQ8TMG9_PERAM|nr:hypothetical protein ANN_09861 [Periplaneta americana]